MKRAEKAAMIGAYNKRLARDKEKRANTPLIPISELIGSWSFQDIARATGLTVGAISYIMRGERIPRADNAIRIARFLGVKVEDFVAAVASARKRTLALQKAGEGTIGG